MSCLQGICAFMSMPLPATFSVLAISIITLPFSIYYPGQDITYFWTHNKIAEVQKWPVVKSAQTAPITFSAQGEKFLFV